ncbi:hypothetical protein FRC07_013453 [Ceratobasidium sp. 392]|nr:hypothetical protein FRC07_013453 [Ceratobasidium sp. 392]
MSPETPLLTTSQFILASGFFAGSYVGSIYVLQSARLGGSARVKSRDDPEVIKARLLATLRDAVRPSIKLLGLVPPSPALRPLLLTPLLYLGPLYSAWLDKSLPFMSDWSYQRDIVQKFASWTGIRNFFMSPLTEELVFRSCVIGAAQLAGIGLKKTVFLTPLWFGIGEVFQWQLPYFI